MTRNAMQDSSPAPRGRDEVVAALRRAAAELFADRGARAVSVREIASRAGVNHGLLHRHFGSKEALRRDVFEATAASFRGHVSDTALASGDATQLFERLAESDHYWRILGRAMLDGEDPSELQASFPVIEQMLDQRRRTLAIGRDGEPGDPADDDTARLDVAMLLALSLGWLVFEPFIRRATGLDREAAAATRARMVGRLTRAAGWGRGEKP